METKYLKTFLAVAQYSSFSRAAEETHLSQPAVSKRIALLEQELGVKLFDRIGRQVQLTEAGDLFRERALHLVNEYEHTLALLESASGDTAGVLSIGISHHLGLHRLPAVMHQFRKSYPAVKLDIRFMDSELAHELVARGDIELAAITLSQRAEQRIESIELWNDRLVFVCNQEHPLAGNRAKLQLADIAPLPCCLPSAATYTGRIIERGFREQNLALNPVLVTNYMETLARMAEVGLGWSVIPETLLSEARLYRLDLDVSLGRRLGLIRNSGRTLTRAAEAFIQTARSAVVPETPNPPGL